MKTRRACATLAGVTWGYPSTGILAPPAGRYSSVVMGIIFGLAITVPWYPDCNSDRTLNLADFGCFQAQFAAGCR